jgi:hypothetical protein
MTGATRTAEVTLLFFFWLHMEDAPPPIFVGIVWAHRASPGTVTPYIQGVSRL